MDGDDHDGKKIIDVFQDNRIKSIGLFEKKMIIGTKKYSMYAINQL